MNTRIILIIVAVVLGILAIAAIPTIISLNNGTLSLTVVPADTVVKIDGNGTKAGNTGMSAGNHKVALSRDGFASQDFTVNIKSGQTTNKSVVMIANSPVGTAWINNNIAQSSQAEGIAGKNIEDTGAVALANHKIIELLPYVGADFKIDYGSSKINPNDSTAVALYVTAATVEGHDKANIWIIAQGFTPGNFEIISQGLMDGE